MLSKKLREKREEAELTQNEVAEELHVSPQSISKWERGEALPSVEFLPKLAEIYNCKIDDFFNEKISVEVKIPQSEPIDKTLCFIKNSAVFLTKSKAFFCFSSNTTFCP